VVPRPPALPGLPVVGVTRFVVRVDANVVRLSWRAPAGGDRGVAIVRRIGRKPRSVADGTVVYRGRGAATVDFPVGPRRVWYAAFALGTSGRPAAPAYASIPRFLPALLLPHEGATVSRTVRFAWRAARGADYYNVQVWNASMTRRVAIRWPSGRTLRVALRPGRYRWYVYPGFGAKARARYGGLHGQGTFVVR
jgi:hypothetical protein